MCNRKSHLWKVVAEHSEDGGGNTGRISRLRPNVEAHALDRPHCPPQVFLAPSREPLGQQVRCAAAVLITDDPRGTVVHPFHQRETVSKWRHPGEGAVCTRDNG